jgi:hypothetical protein
VTTCALVAAEILGRSVPFTAADVTTAVVKRLALLPSNVFVDPELRADPRACVHDALRGLASSGAAYALTNGTYALTGHCSDRRFPHIVDMIAYQTAMLEETLECAAALATPAAIPVTA